MNVGKKKQRSGVKRNHILRTREEGVRDSRKLSAENEKKERKKER